MIRITVKNFQKRIPITAALSAKLRKLVRNCWLKERPKKSVELAICFVTDKKIKELNLRYFFKNLPTDVIAFEIGSDKKALLVDIVVSVDTAVSNAGVYKTTPLYELYLYVLHGVLHLLGYTDKNKKQQKIMHDKAVRILAAAGI